MTNPLYKHPRLYLNAPLAENESCALSEEQGHYLKNVLRKKDNDSIRIFNGREGEWLASLSFSGKKDARAKLLENIRAQKNEPLKTHLYFAPIKKNRMDVLIEKAVELGVTDLHPIITNRTEVRTINQKRMEAQIIEAAEQCERLTLPQLHPVQSFWDLIHEKHRFPILICFERAGQKLLNKIHLPHEVGFLIGPEGGFDEDESSVITLAKNTQAVSLGENILRAETAALACLAYARLSASV